jgi:hypothetical protein
MRVTGCVTVFRNCSHLPGSWVSTAGPNLLALSSVGAVLFFNSHETITHERKDFFLTPESLQEIPCLGVNFLTADQKLNPKLFCLKAAVQGPKKLDARGMTFAKNP